MDESSGLGWLGQGGDGPEIEIRTFGGFSLRVAGRPLAYGRKAPRKLLGLLKATVALGKPEVCEHRLTDALWPEADADAAHQAFNMALHRLRKLLGMPQAIVLREGRVHLNPQHCRVDRWTLERLAVEAEAAGPSARDPEEFLREVLACYRGVFLPDDHASWTLGPRNCLSVRFVWLVSSQARRLEAAGRWEEALRYFQQAIDIQENSEILYQGAMRAALRLGRRAEGVAVFRRLEGVLPACYGVEPSAISRHLLSRLLD